VEDADLRARGAPADRARRLLTSVVGFTLIELVVTLAIIAIGLVATHRVFLETLDATAGANARTRASAIAAREVEEVQAIPYDQVGLPTGSPTTFEGVDTVIFDGSTIPHTGPSETIDGVVFSITRWIAWEPGTSPYADAIKRVVAIVGWTDDAGAHEVRADAAVYPGGLGPYSGTGTTTTTSASLPGTPTDLQAQTNVIDPLNQIDLSWTPGIPGPTHWEIQVSSDAGANFDTITDTHPGAYTTYSAVGLSAETVYTFRVRGRSAPGNSGWSNLAAAATVDPTTECVVNSASADPGTVRKTQPEKLSEDVRLTVHTAGVCGTIRAVFDTSPGNTKTVVFNKLGDQYKYNIWKVAYTDWSTGNKIIYVKNSSDVEIAQISLTVTN